MKTIGGVRFFRGVLFVKDANSIATKDKIYQGKKKRDRNCLVRTGKNIRRARNRMSKAMGFGVCLRDLIIPS